MQTLHNQKAKIAPNGIAYWRAGNKGSPVLLIMGFGMSGLAWELQFNELCKTHQVVCYDHLGLGKSQPLQNQSISMQSMAEHALSLMDYLGWKTAHIVGVSMGGMVAQHIALTAKHRIKSLTLIASTAGGLLALIPSLEGLIRFIKVNFAKNDEQRFKGIIPLLFPANCFPDIDQESYQKMVQTYGYDAPKNVRLAHLKSLLKHNTVKGLGLLAELSVVIIFGKKDILINPKQSKKLHQMIKNSSLICFDEAGHGLMNQCATQLNQVLLKHFSTSEKTRSATNQNVG